MNDKIPYAKNQSDSQREQELLDYKKILKDEVLNNPQTTLTPDEKNLLVGTVEEQINKEKGFGKS